MKSLSTSQTRRRIRRVFRLFLFAAASGLAVTCVAPNLTAADEDPNKCSNATLRGDYGLYASGLRLVPPPNGIGQLETHATIALRTYDGKGGFKGVGIVSSGQVSGVIQGTPTSGTYEVNADCSGIVTIVIPGVPVTIKSAFVIVGRGTEIREVPLAKGEVGMAVLRKM